MSAAPNTARSMVGRVVLGRYRILRHLADGGMGAIYLARSEGSGGFVRPVVVKFLLPGLIADERMIRMFTREARIMSNLRHPGIVSVIDFAEEDDMHIMVLDYVHGFHLGRWNKYIKKTRGTFPAEVAIYILMQVLRALHYAHTLKDADGSSLNIVHRDVTPSNILIDVEGHVKLADFGIARTNTERTEGGKRAIKGKFPYLAPELLEGVDPSPGTDVYSAGVTLHELLIGENEFRAANVPAIVSRVLKHQPTPLDRVRHDLPAGLSEVVANSLIKDPAHRYTSALELAEALARVRRLTEDEAASQLAQMASSDFRSAAMPAFLAVPDLATLEASWKTAGAERGEASGEHAVPPARNETHVTPDTDPSITTGTTDRSRRQTRDRTVAHSPASKSAAAAGERGQDAQRLTERVPKQRMLGAWPVVAAAMAMAVLGAVAAVALTRPEPAAPQEPAYIVMTDRPERVGREPAPAALELAPEIEPEAEPEAEPAPAPEPATQRDRPRRKDGADTASRLTRAFGRQKNKVQACFNRHAVDVSGAPEIAVRFELTADGRVAAAQVLPAPLGDTALGQCILQVARSTRFGAVGKPVAFRVPIKARVK